MPEYHPLGDSLAENLLTMARVYAKARKIKLASVSRFAHGDSRAFQNLSRGKGSITLRKYDSSMGWLFGHWPEGEPFPVLPFDVQLSSPKNGG